MINYVKLSNVPYIESLISYIIRIGGTGDIFPGEKLDDTFSEQLIKIKKHEWLQGIKIKVRIENGKPHYLRKRNLTVKELDYIYIHKNDIKRIKLLSIMFSFLKSDYPTTVDYINNYNLNPSNRNFHKIINEWKRDKDGKLTVKSLLILYNNSFIDKNCFDYKIGFVDILHGLYCVDEQS